VLQVKPLDHSHELPPPGRKGRTYICSCIIFPPSTEGAKILLMKGIEEMKEQLTLVEAKEVK
jgi:rhamnogalacturonan II specific xylosyltransferase